MSGFECIGVIVQLQHPEIKSTLERLIAFLKGRGCSIIIDRRDMDIVDYKGVPFADSSAMAAEVDLVLVVGGDGTMLGAARDLADFDVPVLGVNRGRLGFLTDILPSEAREGVSRVLDGHYVTTNRFLLDIQVSRGGEIVGEGTALNDVVLHPGKSVRMMEFELYIDSQFVYSQRSDGLIVSTPTGSTAYALSAGGPIMHPALDAIALVPMNAHTLTSRPLVVAGDSAIEARVGKRNDIAPIVTCDGQKDTASLPGDTIGIKKHPKSIKLLHPENHNFYQVCRAKLGWGSRLGKVGESRES